MQDLQLWQLGAAVDRQGVNLLKRLTESLRARPSNPFFRCDFGPQRAEKLYLIATTGGPGGARLCKRIAEHGDLGFPMEFLNESYIAEFDRLFPNPNLDDYLHYVARAFTSTTQVFGLKTDWWRFQIARELRLADKLLGHIDLIVHLRCRDFVAQAISMSLAEDDEVLPLRDVGTDRHANAVYDAEAIKRHARNILNQEFQWRRFIAAAGPACLELVYEDITVDMDAAVRGIAGSLGVSMEGPPPTAGPDRESPSEVAEAWRRRFQEECEDFVAFWTAERDAISPAAAGAR